MHVDAIHNDYIALLSTFVEVSNVELTQENSSLVSFKARININSEDYRIVLTQEAKYIIMTTNGNIIEYDVFGEHLKYNAISNKIGKYYKYYRDLAKANFFGVTRIEDISYIKITGIELQKADISNTVLGHDLEVELYSK